MSENKLIAKAPPRAEKQRLSAEDWENAALELLAQEGVSAVAVEPLAKRLGVTKGSFYWHFPTRDALLEAALKRWENDDRGDVMSRVEVIPDPRDRLRQLIRLTSRTLRTHRVMSALLNSIDHPLVGPVIGRINEQRLKYVTETFVDAGMDAVTAGHRARLTYTSYVGFMQLAQTHSMPKMGREDFDNYIEHMVQTLVPGS